MLNATGTLKIIMILGYMLYAPFPALSSLRFVWVSSGTHWRHLAILGDDRISVALGGLIYQRPNIYIYIILYIYIPIGSMYGIYANIGG